MGYVLGLGWQARGVSETQAYGRGALLALALGEGLELAPLAVVSRTPDLTDAVVCAAGACAGTALGTETVGRKAEGREP
ncbi:MAG: hypothetical protein ACE5JO_14020 [Candidatus Binatia bacterium]